MLPEEVTETSQSIRERVGMGNALILRKTWGKKNMESGDVLIQKYSLLCETGSFFPGHVSSKRPYSKRSFSHART